MKTDEDEHSIEMHLPYIAKVMEDFKDQFTIIPVLVGSLAPEVEQMYGELFAPYLADPQNLFVISSDFCHWGNRFRYDYYDKSAGPIWKSIENLDKNVSFHQIWFKIQFMNAFIILGYGSYRDFKPRSVHWIFKEASEHDLWSSPNIRFHAINKSTCEAELWA